VNEYLEDRNEKGFTLIELLIAIVVVGILAAVAIVGIAGLTNTGGKSACKASQDAATASSAAYYANSINAAVADPTPWPKNFTELTTGGATAPYTAPSGAVITDTATGGTMKVGSWTLTMTSDGTSAPTWSGC
jgi:prepilin-type N-terminal cleavage/methylation domain-containing protein